MLIWHWQVWLPCKTHSAHGNSRSTVIVKKFPLVFQGFGKKGQTQISLTKSSTLISADSTKRRECQIWISTGVYPSFKLVTDCCRHSPGVELHVPKGICCLRLLPNN